MFINEQVKSHERAHLSAGAGLVVGGANYQYQRGPDGKMYAVGGEVKIDTSRENDPEGTIRIILYYPQELGRNMDEILRAVKAMQVSDKYGVAMPAQWPDSEVVGKDHVILPPAKDVESARQRLSDAKAGKFECLDWWLCHKELKDV